MNDAGMSSDASEMQPLLKGVSKSQDLSRIEKGWESSSSGQGTPKHPFGATADGSLDNKKYWPNGKIKEEYREAMLLQNTFRYTCEDNIKVLEASEDNKDDKKDAFIWLESAENVLGSNPNNLDDYRREKLLAGDTPVPAQGSLEAIRRWFYETLSPAGRREESVIKHTKDEKMKIYNKSSKDDQYVRDVIRAGEESRKINEAKIEKEVKTSCGDKQKKDGVDQPSDHNKNFVVSNPSQEIHYQKKIIVEAIKELKDTLDIYIEKGIEDTIIEKQAKSNYLEEKIQHFIDKDPVNEKQKKLKELKFMLNNTRKDLHRLAELKRSYEESQKLETFLGKQPNKQSNEYKIKFDEKEILEEPVNHCIEDKKGDNYFNQISLKYKVLEDKLDNLEDKNHKKISAIQAEIKLLMKNINLFTEESFDEYFANTQNAVLKLRQNDGIGIELESNDNHDNKKRRLELLKNEAENCNNIRELIEEITAYRNLMKMHKLKEELYKYAKLKSLMEKFEFYNNKEDNTSKPIKEESESPKKKDDDVEAFLRSKFTGSTDGSYSSTSEKKENTKEKGDAKSFSVLKNTLTSVKSFNYVNKIIDIATPF